MTTTENITTRSGLTLRVEKRTEPQGVEVRLHAQSVKPCVLHWGVRRPDDAEWKILPPSAWPAGTIAADSKAMRTPFVQDGGDRAVTIRLDAAADYAFIDFVLHFPDESRWDNNGGRNYQIALPGAGKAGGSPQEAIRRWLGKDEATVERLFEVGSRCQLAAAVKKTGAGYQVALITNLPAPIILHWGIARRSPYEWLLPPESMRTPETVLAGALAVQTPFASNAGLRELRFDFPENEAPLGIQFVLKQGDCGWLKDRGGNFYLPVSVAAQKMASLDTAQLAGLADEIVRAESRGSWTLMHRFNLCHDLLERARNNVEGLALLYVWLRFSAVRQLTWQRNFNTKPRELSHAQERLTHKLADLYRGESEGRPFLRLMLATVGRGGEGQRIRDEILNIMHRHHVKEVSGHFMEEWHQKLHNNTTPDDIVICEAFLEFLYSNGNRDRFYQVLQEGGVTRQRLESFERPIRSSPDFVPHLKDGLIHDFQNFLKTLKAVHAGADFETAVNAACGQLDGDTQGLLWHVWNHRNDPADALVPLVEQITNARHRLSNQLNQGSREVLYLDLALEQLVRVAVERNLHARLNGDQLVNLISCVLENVALSHEDRELGACKRHWERLQQLPRFSAGWSLHAKSVADRIGRALSDWIDRFYQMLQPKAEFLGRGFNADSWAVSLFSEEVVRGSSLGFVLSMLLRQLDPVLRKAANLSAWQIVSRGSGTGKVEVVGELRSIQGRRIGAPIIVVADKVSGDEEIPDGVAAVIAPDVTDLVSHVAVRARNANLLFASCHDPAVIERLKSLAGHQLHLSVTAAGDVVFEETKEAAAAPAKGIRAAKPAITRPKFTRFAVALKEFNKQLVGAKSLHQARLRGKLPEWIRQPAAMAVPFGVFEKILSAPVNEKFARRYADLNRQANLDGTKVLPDLRETVLSLSAPDELKTALLQTAAAAGLTWPGNWDDAWQCIKRVWASKWNERAFLSRETMGLPHEDLFMAVLIQPVIEGEYAFVIHTANPSTGSRDEIYGEVVLGLGETLVGNYPGRSLSFTFHKKSGELKLLSFPSKSAGLYGGGLIFRSDSNGEDLAGFAGAGLYDSVLLQPPKSVPLDYSGEPLVWDEGFRNERLGSIARMGVEIEKALGSPQDIEGVLAKGDLFLVQTRPQVGVTNE